jgi:hypothetical protein
MDAERKWLVNVEARTASHSSGLILAFEGVPESDHFAGSPKNMPRDISAVALARLIREGFDEFRIAYQDKATVRPVLMLKTR